ncbi:MAG TPA: thiamine pyrophosphate-binding protein [Jatrophihabitans sp.]|uniref:thiamine pyrophosphate-binding protein n=1 Tax=Jatrophihabitans sp. TaxID=1932789 RepID=UPI002DF9986A|nr:thiamine pyrophosphate-binding protein [Jatrophihabitans sp.]
MRVGEAVGRILADLGVGHVFGVVGSGNFHVTNALAHAGVGFVAARHENGAASMADGYARTSGRVAALSVHQGCGLTNAMTAIAEAAKSRTPLIVLAAEANDPRSNFYVDQDALARSVGAVPRRVTGAADAVEVTVAAYRTAVDDRRTVLLNLPLAAQAEELDGWTLPAITPAGAAAADDVTALADAIAASQRPVFVAGQGARSPAARDALIELAGRCGALLATSAAAKGLFHDEPFSLDVSGGFATPLAAELIRDADLIVGWGCALNMWTTRHGELIGPGATVVQVDVEGAALGRHRSIDHGVVGDVTAVAGGVLADTGTRYRTDGIRHRIATEGRWRDVAYDDTSSGDRIDPRTLTVALDDLLPAERTVSVDSGNFMGYPSMFLSVPDELGFVFTQAFQSIGLGLGSAIGAAIARPDRLTVAALGDGGATMGAAELDTVARLGLDLLIVVYNDEAYGAEVHHFGPDGHDLGTVRFPETDLASIARGFGLAGVTVRRVEDLDAVATWVAGGRPRPLLIDAKIVDDGGSWWLKEAFRGH